VASQSRRGGVGSSFSNLIWKSSVCPHFKPEIAQLVGGYARQIGATSQSEFIIIIIIIIYYHRYYYHGTEDAKSPALAAKLTTTRGQRLFADKLQTAAAAAEDTHDWPAETVWKRSQTSCRRGHAKQFTTAAQTNKSYLQPPHCINIIYYPNNKFYAKIWLRNESRVGEKTTDKSGGVLAIDHTKNIIIMIYDDDLQHESDLSLTRVWRLFPRVLASSGGKWKKNGLPWIFA